MGGGSLRAYTIAAVIVLAAALACYAAAYPVLKPAAFLIPSVVLFFGTRSFGSYLVMLIPAAIAAAATTAGRPPAVPCWRHWRWVVLGGAAACAAAVTAALTAASPLAISIRSVQTTGQLATAGPAEPGRHQQHRRTRPARLHDPGRHDDDGLLAARSAAPRCWRRISGPATRSWRRAISPCPPSVTASRCWLSRRARHRSAGPAPMSRAWAGWCSGPRPIDQPVAPGRRHHGAGRDREPAGSAHAGRGRARLPRPGDLRPARPGVQPGHHQPRSAGPDARRGAHELPRRGHLHASARRSAAATPCTSRPTWSSRDWPIRMATRRFSRCGSADERGSAHR